MIKTNRFSPSSTTIRLEAVWTLTVGHRRSHAKTVARLLKLLRPELKNNYQPTNAKLSGHYAKLVHCTMEEADSEEAWPVW